MQTNLSIIMMFGLPNWVDYIIWTLLVVLLLFSAKALLGIVFIPEDKTGLIVKKFVLIGTNKELPEGRIIATKGEAGYQAHMLPPGLHFFYWPWQYSIEKIPFTIVQEGQMILIEAKDGDPLTDGHITADSVESNNFQDAKLFLENKGQKGKQRNYLTPGVYRINTALFSRHMVNVTDIEQNKVGIVTVMDGTPLPKDEIAGKIIGGHGNFQNADAFIRANGNRGLQEQILLAGQWYINPWFAEVKIVPMTTIDIGNVGVVVSYVGDQGIDTSGDNFKHGKIVKKGQKGVWEETLDPGKYAINTDIMHIIQVPTTNIVLNWASARNESHLLDKNLSTIIARSSDGFTFNIDVSQIINISNTSAPKVIARFGSVQNLVSQVLEPTIGNYFRNSAQQSDVIDFLKERSKRQEEAKNRIVEVLKEYDVTAVDTLIGDLVPPAQLMKTLTDRKIAEQERTTFETQKLAQEKRRELEAATASANMQSQVVEAERGVEIAEKVADAKVKTAKGDADSKTINAEADAKVTTVTANAEAGATTVKGEATAKVVKLVGTSEAEVLKMKTEALGPLPYAQIEVSKNLSTNKMQLVPQILISGSNGHGGGTLVDALLSAKFLETTMMQPAKTEPKKEDEK